MSQASPKVGFVSLGCPKALVDSERILTQLRVEGYEIVPSYGAADVRGGQHLRLHRRGRAGIARRHRRGAGRERQGDRHRLPRQARRADPRALTRTCSRSPVRRTMTSVMRRGARAPAAEARSVPRHLMPADTGIKLTPKHYAYLKISEGCNHRCSFCIIPSMRGDLVSRPVGRGAARSREPGRRPA